MIALQMIKMEPEYKHSHNCKDDTLDILTDIDKEENIQIYLVVNTSKFETKDKTSILEYMEFNSGENKKPWKKITGLISNTHLGDETTYQDIIRGYNILKEVSIETNIPIIAISADEKFKKDFPNLTYQDIPVRLLNRLMPRAIW